MNDLKNKVTNIVAFIVAIGTVIMTALGSVPPDAQWYVWIGAVCIAVIAWFTGKGTNGKNIS